jgi:hypothetical protein
MFFLVSALAMPATKVNPNIRMGVELVVGCIFILEFWESTGLPLLFSRIDISFLNYNSSLVFTQVFAAISGITTPIKSKAGCAPEAL